MSLIKRANIKQTGEIILEKKPVKITKDIKLDFFEPREEITDDQPYIEKDIPDEVKLSETLGKFKKIITVEENTVIGGFGAFINLLLFSMKLFDKKILNIGAPDRFIEAGEINELHKTFGFDDESLLERIKNFIR